MKNINIRVTDGDLEIIKKEAASQQYEVDEYLERFFSEAFRSTRAKYAKAEREELARKYRAGLL